MTKLNTATPEDLELVMLKESSSARLANSNRAAARCRSPQRLSVAAMVMVLGLVAAGPFVPACAAHKAPVAAAPAANKIPSAAAPETAGSSTPLDRYLNDLKSLRATFLQTLADSQGREIDRSTGTLIVARPGKFSWEIHPQAVNTAAGPGAGNAASASNATGTAAGKATAAAGSKSGAGQLMVSDGRNLWFLDRDLEQVTVKPVDAALSATPAMLLSGTVDVRKNFNLTSAGTRDGFDWVLVEPHGADADFRDALFGFAGGELKRMILEDKLGQTATIIFDRIERNGPVTPQETSFTPPKGTDIIGTPRK
ncbi:MAG: outer rane lipoprotein carrier protein LolA [Gammaproteobacteria bacterium]|nr:outer rane lipoprotein carrier protein LolA [Gammaproteobacteria bacterium]